MNKLQQGLPRGNEKAVRKSLTEAKRIARGLAPERTGKLKAGIKGKMFVRKGEVIGVLSSSVPGKFPYNLWINEISPFKYATLARRRVWTKGAKTRGAWPTRATRARWPGIYTKRWLYRNTKNPTGHKFFERTIKLMEDKFPKTVERELVNTIKRAGFK